MPGLAFSEDGVITGQSVHALLEPFFMLWVGSVGCEELSLCSLFLQSLQQGVLWFDADVVQVEEAKDVVFVPVLLACITL